MNTATAARLEAAGYRLRTAGIAAPVEVGVADGRAEVSAGPWQVRADVLDRDGRVVATATGASEAAAVEAAAAALAGGAS